MKKRFLTIIITLFCISGSYSQVTTISQPDIGANWFSGVDQWGGQSFLITQSGLLTEIRFNTLSPEGLTTFELRQGENTAGALLYTTVINIAASGWISVPLPNIPVCEGTFCFLLSGFQWGAMNVNDPYTNGNVYYSGSWIPGWDMAFEVDQFINETPEITSGLSNLSVCSGQTIPLTSFTITDEDVANVIVTGTSSNTSIIPNGNFVFGGTGANRTLSFSSPASVSGTTTITINVADTLCSKDFTFNITVNPLPSVSAGPDITVCQGQSVTLGATGSGGVFFSWNNGVVDGASFIPAASANYVVTGTDGNGCQAMDAMSLTVNNLPVVDAGIDMTICEGDLLTLNGSGANTYLWDNGVTDGVSFAPSSTLTYTVIGTDINFCTDSDVIVVTVNSLPTVTFNGVPTFCDNDTPYTFVEGSPSGGTYSGSGISSNIFSPSSVGAGLWTILYSYTDGNGCINSDNETITVLASPSVIASADISICTGETTTISVTGSAVSFSWNNSLGAGTSFNVSPSTNINYIVTGDGGDGCSAVDSVFVTVNPLPIVSLDLLPSVCMNASPFALTQGSPAGGVYSGTGTSGGNFDPSLAGAGTHLITYTYTDGNGCINSDDEIIEVYSVPVVIANASDVTLCIGEFLILNGSGADSYVWDNGVTNDTAFQPAIGTVLYTVTGSALNGCEATDQISVSVFDLPIVSGGPDQIICEDESFLLSGSGADSYAWSDGSINGSTLIKPAGVYNYFVIGTDINSCFDTAFITVIINENPVLSVSPDQYFCQGDTIYLTASGASSYSWESGVSILPSYALTPLATQSINLVGTTNGCSVSTDILLTYDDPDLISAGQDVTICAGFSTLLSAGGGISYEWNGPTISGITTGDFLLIVDTSGYYSVTVQTVNGCTYSDSIFITQNTSSSCTIEPLNSFSPNGDAVNEEWRIQGIEGFPENHVTILNRWGDIVFNADNYDNSTIMWNGTDLSGSDVPDGTYFFIIEIESIPAQTGWLQLFK